jgi:hypothetical protein
MERIIEGMPYLPMDEASRELKTTGLRILMLIKRGVMRGRQLEGEWFVEKGSMNCFRSHEADGAKPGGCKGNCGSGGCGT